MTERNLAVELRPKDFNEYIGNAKTVSQIRSQLDSGRIPTAFLLSGPTGCGKTTLARCISTRLNGELVETNAADDTGVDAARALGDAAAHRPLMGDYKVIVLDEAHQLTKQAQNALLKYVEDAPPSTIWIFCTTEPTKLIPTLRGRCLSYALAGLAGDQVALLVYRGLQYLGRKGDAKTEEFIKVLIREGVTCPRPILMAVERYVGGMDPIASIYSSSDSPGAFQIAQAVAKKDWLGIKQGLSTAQADEAVAIRLVIVNYLKAMLLRNRTGVWISDSKWTLPQLSNAILELTRDVPAIEVLGLANLSAILVKVLEVKD